MFTNVRSTVCSIATLLLTIPAANALSIVTFSDGPGTTGGGEFNAVTSSHGNFITFCLEYREQISYGSQFYYGVSQSARWNGNGTVDPLSRATAWLYLQFLNGTLGAFGATYAYAHTNADANDLQKAIWFLEGEQNGANNYYAQLAVQQAGPTTLDNDGFYNVGVMNVWSNPDGTGARQDQLIRFNVPDYGSTAALLGAALSGIVFLRRKFAV